MWLRMRQQEVGSAISIGGHDDDEEEVEEKDEEQAESKSQKIIDNWQMCELNFQTISPVQGVQCSSSDCYPGFGFCSWRFSPARRISPAFPLATMETCMI